ncbi:MAG: tRNA (adenosine(37)-N6)-threonylcarbamoyltransferase complex dimerization subunit type 1 TsaB [Balneolaceae bacterium]|nr:tRNA (adenosine(37)-N6)-threonylcarbamoyltransferase complex dimerization subunit type 1 TsaB [Balneolaceae bacterium]
MILAIETSTPVCSVALGKNSRTIVEKRIEGRGVHSERTFTFTRELLDRHEIGIRDLEAVLFSHGPGSYTGLRIGAAAIKGLLFQRDVPLWTLPTLFSFAVPFLNRYPARVHAVIDARRQHLYHQKTEYPAEEKLVISEPKVVELTRLEGEIQQGDIVVGTGWNRMEIENRDQISFYGTEAISAKNLIQGWYHPLVKPHFLQRDVQQFEPEYLTLSQVNNSSV